MAFRPLDISMMPLPGRIGRTALGFLRAAMIKRNVGLLSR